MRSRFLLACLAVLVPMLALLAPARADEEDRLFDFTDAFYKANGVDPAAIGGRRQADGVRAVTGTAPFRYQRDVRALVTFPAHDHSGDLNFFTVMGGGSVSLFTDNAAGRNARKVADASPEYVFPKAGTGAISLNTRQAVILDMRNGYFSNNPAGLWIHTFVSYTAKATGTAAGKAALADLAKKNGLDSDGTPIIRTIDEIETLFKAGYVTKVVPATTDPLRYAICPVNEDPTDGGIAPDQFLAYNTRADGSPVEPEFLVNFVSLQKTGKWFD